MEILLVILSHQLLYEDLARDNVQNSEPADIHASTSCLTWRAFLWMQINLKSCSNTKLLSEGGFEIEFHKCFPSFVENFYPVPV